MSTSVFDEGLDAFLDDKERKDNPYEINTDNNKEWDAGWLQGEHDSEIEEDD